MADRPLTTPSAREPLVSIGVPCYRQLHYARGCVQSILAQSLGDFELTLLDDGASDDYRTYVESLGDPRVRYQRNPVRLGAMGNMFEAIMSGRGKYCLAFHEDDLLGSAYLAAAVEILERDPSCGFVASELHEFDEEPSAEELARQSEGAPAVRYASGADFVRGLGRGIEPTFGSIVYRKAALAGIRPEHERFATLVDRPFLLAILERWSAAIIREPLVWYRRHGDGDDRHLAMAPEHILNLLARYRACLPARLGREDAALFYGYSGYWLFTLYRLVPPSERTSLRRFVLRAWRQGLYNPRWSRGYGRKRLLALLVTGR